MSYETILTPENFELAWRRIRNSSITTTKDRLGLKVFSQALDFHIHKLIHDIYEGEYVPQSPSILFLPKKSGRLRPFTLLNMRDRLVYQDQAIGNILIENTYDHLESRADVSVFSPVLAGIDKDYVFYPSLRRGDDFEGQFLKFTRRQAEIINSGQFDCVVCADIASFYPSIDHNLLIIKLLSNNWLDFESCELLRTCLEVWTAESPEAALRKSLPIGYETSDLLANLFLNEIDEALDDYVFLRYVDDIRVFTANHNQGEQILNRLDVALQRQGLLLQATKSSVNDLADFSSEERLNDLEEQQVLLSSIDRDINSPNAVLQELADRKLRNLLIEVLGLQNWEALQLDERIEPTEEIPLFFSLYRIREKTILLRDLSLDLLDSHPHRSYAIVRYLTLFRDDEVVIEKLWNIVFDESKHGQVRANCLRGIYELSNDLDQIRAVARSWITSRDLSLSFCGIELIQQFTEERQYLLNILGDVSSPQVQYSLISTAFTLTESENEKTKLISYCLHHDDYMMISLGVSFLSTQISLLPEFVGHSDSIAENLIIYLQRRVAVDNLEYNLRTLFGIQDIVENSLSRIPNSGELNQLTINMILSRETNRDEYLRNLAEFLTRFSDVYQKMTGKTFASVIDNASGDERIGTAFEHIRIGLMNLSDSKSSLTFQGTKPALAYFDTEKLHEGVSQIISHTIEELIELVENVPDEILDEIPTSDESRIPMIFFSYSHDDDKERDTLKKKLKYLETRGMAKLWCDRQIPAGQVWSLEIEEKLNASKIVLFLISSNFMGSEFIHNEEMPRAIQNFENQMSVCIPIILEDCDWAFHPYKFLQALPDGALAITQWTRPDSAYKNIQTKIREVLSMLENNKYEWKPLPK